MRVGAGALRQARAPAHGLLRIGPRQVQTPFVHAVPRRAMATGTATVARVVIGRLILIPAAIFTGGAAGLETLRSYIPDIPDPGFRDAAAQALVFWGELKKSLFDAADSLTPAPSSAQCAAATPDANPASSSSNKTPETNPATAQPPTEPTVEMLQAELDALRRRLETQEHELADAGEAHRRELLQTTASLQREIDDLKEENGALRRSLVTTSNPTGTNGSSSGSSGGGGRPRRAIELFSDILALRARADPAFAAEDHLPRVVVVGDQSAGKTSVLEMLVRARIFPRGLGEMMTRSPIQVTLSEGSEPVAVVKGLDGVVFRLDRPADLARLRAEIERRMLAGVAPGESVAATPVALDVRGPGLRPMVLVDLPGLIQHTTRGMHPGTKDAIRQMLQQHVDNPNAILLCIQDASRDAEGSSVADVVRHADPDGQRTIFVLTKVDVAEQLNKPAAQLAAVLRGQKFDMKARSYFAVVTGTRNADDSIDAIRRAEQQYFEASQLFQTGAFTAKQMGTNNLARAVSDAFWERVHRTVHEELATTHAALKKKEAEWKNRYPGALVMNKDDVFARGRHAILEHLARLTQTTTPQGWEARLADSLWADIRTRVFDGVYLPSAAAAAAAAAASTASSAGGNSGFAVVDGALFRTRVDAALDAWAARDLPERAVAVAGEVLRGELYAALPLRDGDAFRALHARVRANVAERFHWDPRSTARLRSLLELRLRDDLIRSPLEWTQAVDFMRQRVAQERAAAAAALAAAEGPGLTARWLHWQSLTPAQLSRRAAVAECRAVLRAATTTTVTTATSATTATALPRRELTAAEVQTVVHNVKIRHGREVTAEFVRETYAAVHREHFLQLAEQSAAYCAGRFGVPEEQNRAPNGLQCRDVVLFWRLQHGLQSAGTLLRVEAAEYRKELEREVRTVLEDLAGDAQAKLELFDSPQVRLAEEIEVIRLIQSKLEAFVRAIEAERKV